MRGSRWRFRRSVLGLSETSPHPRAPTEGWSLPEGEGDLKATICTRSTEGSAEPQRLRRTACLSILFAACLAVGGCHDLGLEAQQGASPLAKDPPNNGLRKGAAASPAGPSAPTATSSAASADRAALAHGQWNQAVEMLPAEAEETEPVRDTSFHWRHPPLEDILGRPAADRFDLRPLLADKDAVVAGNAAIGLTRLGDSSGAERLAATVRAPEMRLSMRCAAVEALASLPDAASLELLRKLADQYGYTPPKKSPPADPRQPAVPKPPSSPYIPELHAELVRGLARRVDAGEEPRLAAALASPAPAVRIEALRAWAASRSGDLPAAAADLRTSSDPRVRAAALRTLVARRHPQVQQWLGEALRDVALPVRLAAISGLGALGRSAVARRAAGVVERARGRDSRRRRDRLGPRRRKGGGL